MSLHIQAILEAHTQLYDWHRCSCGMTWVWDGNASGAEQHRAHVTELIEQHIQGRERAAQAAGFMVAVNILRSEARWQLELYMRHNEHRYKHCADRMIMAEDVMRNFAEQYKEES